jgi:HEAT repeat protein
MGTVSTADAGEFLRALARTGEGRASVEALQPLVLLDSTPRWEILAAAARDSSRLLRYRRRAADILARAAAGTLGTDDSADDDPTGARREAVYAFARRRGKTEDPVPLLMEIARTNTHRDVRRAALYQLGQTADPRVVELFVSMLR